MRRWRGMADRACKNCRFYTHGVTDRQRHEWSYSNLGRWATGVCNLFFPRGYIGREPPHPTMAASSCFQFEERDDSQMDIWGVD